jgi:predicted ArsR family transcriptional regulator
MGELSHKQITEYFRRCFSSVDGLWFLKVEEAFGFDRALSIDNDVWKILPRIQARFIKSAAELGEGMDALLDCLTMKLKIEGFSFHVERERDGKSFHVTVDRCPWHALLQEAGRTAVAAKVGTLICNTEYSALAAEFGDDIRFRLGQMICSGKKYCTLHFQR